MYVGMTSYAVRCSPFVAIKAAAGQDADVSGADVKGKGRHHDANAPVADGFAPRTDKAFGR
jgi:hypothetical protein